MTLEVLEKEQHMTSLELEVEPQAWLEVLSMPPWLSASLPVTKSSREPVDR